MGGGNPWILSGHVTLSYKRIKDNPWIMLIAFDIIVLNIMSGITWGYLQKTKSYFFRDSVLLLILRDLTEVLIFPYIPSFEVKDNQQQCN